MSGVCLLAAKVNSKERRSYLEWSFPQNLGWGWRGGPCCRSPRAMQPFQLEPPGQTNWPVELSALRHSHSALL